MVIFVAQIDKVDQPLSGQFQTTDNESEHCSATLLDALKTENVTSIADISGGEKTFCLDLYNRFDCDIYLINADANGKIVSDPLEWTQDHQTFLIENNVPENMIHIICDQKLLKTVDVLCNLDGYGARYKISGLNSFVPSLLHADSYMYTDIRTGSGAFPFLRRHGNNTILSNFEKDGAKYMCALFQPNPSATIENDEAWDEIATKLAGKDGFYRSGPEGHSFVYTPRSKSTLVVTFDNLDITMVKRQDRRPWGFSFIESQGWSMLGVLAGGWTWFRQQWVSDQFDDLKDSGFFDQFDRVVFYGASMGGYAASVFCAAAPGCDVILMSPQSTLDKSIVPWETRYRMAWHRDYSGKYGDGSTVSNAANKVYILYDPYEPLDSAHTARFQGDNVIKLRAPHMGHRLASSLSQMNILSPIILGALDSTLTSKTYYQLLRKRREFPRYQREIFEKLLRKNHTSMAKKLGKYILAKNPNPRVKRIMDTLKDT